MPRRVVRAVLDVGSPRSAMHGVRSVDVVRALRPELDAVAEAKAIELRQAEDVDGLRAIPGAAGALAAVRADRVAVVTSATRPLAHARLAAMGIEPPAVVVYADDVERGKPDPEGYLRRRPAWGSIPPRRWWSRTRHPASRRAGRPGPRRWP